MKEKLQDKSVKERGPRINEQIRAPQLRLIFEDGGAELISLEDARRMSREKGLDLVEVSPNARPPVVKMIDYGKFKYENQKKANIAKKKQITSQLKEIQLRPNTDIHDLEVKLKKAEEFLERGDKVKLIMQFRGREIAYKKTAMEKFDKVIERVSAIGAIIESPPRFMGMRVLAILAPSKKKV